MDDTSHAMHDARQKVMDAVRTLRGTLGLTQTEFGGRVGKSLPTIQRWEGLRPPTGDALLQLQNLANTHRLNELAGVFRDAFEKEAGHAVIQVPSSDEARRAVLSEILQRFNAGEADHQIIDAFPAFPDFVAMIVGNFRALNQLAKNAAEAKKQ